MPPNEPRVWTLDGGVEIRPHIHGPELAEREQVRVVEATPIMELLERCREQGLSPEVDDEVENVLASLRSRTGDGPR